jgi:serine protease Do
MGSFLQKGTLMRQTVLIFALLVAITCTGAYAAGRALIGATEPATAVPHELPSYREVVKKVLPAVVSIEVKPKVRMSQASMPPGKSSPFGNIPGLPDDLRKELERFGQRPMPEPRQGHAFGSGFIVDPSGLIVTNDHVVRGADEVSVQLHDGRKFVGKAIKRDSRTDLAILRIEAKEALPFLKLGDSDAMEIGDRVLAVGAPLGMTGTVTSGIVSAKGRDIHMNMYEDFLQTDAAINPGNSGGPLVNLAGEVIGVNSAIRSDTGGFQGIGLAISSNLTKDVLDQLQRTGTVVRGYLGVQTAPLDPEVAARLNVPDKAGVVIAKVMSGSPAAKSGMKDGDILVEIAGKAVKDPRTLQRIVAGLEVGKKAELAVFRDGARKTLTLTVEAQPQSFGLSSEGQEQDPTPLGKLGAHVMDLTPKTAKQYGLSEKTTGVIVTEVEPGSTAAEANLKSGMLIVKVDQQAVASVADLQRLLERASLEKGCLLQVRTPQGGTTYILLKSPR